MFKNPTGPGRTSKRILHEYKQVVLSNICDIVLRDERRVDEFLIRFTPKEGHYKGQTLILYIGTKGRGGNYPFSPPSLKLLTPVWHTNISKKGDICVDFLYNKNKWNPTFSFTTLVAQLQLLFMEPEISSGHYNSYATVMFRKAIKNKDFTEFDKKCMEYYLANADRNNIITEFERLYKSQHPNRKSVGL